jgi:hypothetical protein
LVRAKSKEIKVFWGEFGIFIWIAENFRRRGQLYRKLFFKKKDHSNCGVQRFSSIVEKTGFDPAIFISRGGRDGRCTEVSFLKWSWTFLFKLKFKFFFTKVKLTTFLGQVSKVGSIEVSKHICGLHVHMLDWLVRPKNRIGCTT